MTVSLSSVDDLQLVERDRIGAALKELSLASRVDVADALTLKLGEFLAADVVILVEALSKASEPTFRIRAIECRTGVRHLDYLVAGLIDTAAASVTPVLLATRSRIRTQDTARHYIGALGITSIESGTLLLPVARSLSLLLEQDLQRQPSVFVLEREQLQRLRQEESLTGRELSLRRASVQLAGTIRRVDDGKGVEIKLQLQRLDGTGAVEFSVNVNSLEPSKIRPVLAQAVLSQLSSELRPDGNASPVDELAQIRLRRDWLAPNRRWKEAIHLAEAAIALDPQHDDFRRHIQIHKSYAMTLTDWNIDLLLPTLIRIQEARSQFNSFLLEDEDFAGPLVFSFEPHADLPHNTDHERRRPLKHQFDRLRLAEYHRVYEFRRQRGEPTLPLLIQHLRFCDRLAETPAQFMEMAMPLLHEALDDLNQPTLQESFRAEMQQQLFAALIESSHRIEDNKRRLSNHWFVHCDISNVRPFFERLADASDIDLQLIGHHGLSRVPGDVGLKSADRMLTMLVERSKPVEMHLKVSAYRAIVRLQGTSSLDAVFERVYGSPDAPPDPVIFARLGPGLLYLFLAPAERDSQVRWGSHIRKLLATDSAKLIEPRLAVRMEATAKRFIDNRPVRIQITEDPPLRRPTAAEGLWTQYRQIELPLSPGPTRRMRNGKGSLDPHLMGVAFDATDRNSIPEQLVLQWWGPNRRIALHHYRLSDGQHTRIGEVPGFAQLHFHSGLPLVTFDDGYFTATKVNGLESLVKGQSVELGESAGGPGNLISDIARFEDSVLVSIPGSLMRYFPKTGRFETLMSSLRKESSGKFDGGKSWRMDGMTVDASTRSVWMRVRSADDDRRGIWNCAMNDAGDLSCRRAVESPLNDFSQVTPSGEWLYFARAGQWHRIHRKTEAVELLPGYKSIPPESAAGLWRGRFVVVDDHIILARSKTILSPDGKAHVLRDPTQWTRLLPLKNGFIAASLGTYRSPRQHLWRFERLKDSTPDSPSDPGE